MRDPNQTIFPAGHWNVHSWFPALITLQRTTNEKILPSLWVTNTEPTFSSSLYLTWYYSVYHVDHQTYCWSIVSIGLTGYKIHTQCLLLICSYKEISKHIWTNKLHRVKNRLCYTRNVRFFLFRLANSWTVCYDRSVCSHFWRSIFKLFQQLQEATYLHTGDKLRGWSLLRTLCKGFTNA